MERTYQETTFGLDEPQFLWITGKTLRLLASESGQTISVDSNGDSISDTELYLVDSGGIFPVRDD
jgi:hypothetical protein